MNRSRQHPCAIHFIFCCGALFYYEMRTQEDIKKQIDGLEKMKLDLPEFSFFGDNNWANIDAQIDILMGGDLDDYEDEDSYSLAEEAEMWLNEDYDDDLFDVD